MKWTDIWKAPFWTDHYGYIWSAGNVMTFSVEDLTEENDQFIQEFCDNMVKALNGEESRKYENLHVEDGCDLYIGEELIGSFRGWGHLCGGLGLSNEVAAGLQDEMIAYVMDKICKN